MAAAALCFAPLARAQNAPAQDVQKLARAVDDHYNHLRSLESDFTEIYRGDGAERVESGTLWLKKPRKMRWEYRSPKEKLFVSDGQAVWFYLPAERQLRKTTLRKLDDLRSPLAFLLGKTKLENELRGLSKVVDQAPLGAGNTLLRGVPRAMAGGRCGERGATGDHSLRPDRPHRIGGGRRGDDGVPLCGLEGESGTERWPVSVHSAAGGGNGGRRIGTIV